VAKSARPTKYPHDHVPYVQSEVLAPRESGEVRPGPHAARPELHSGSSSGERKLRRREELASSPIARIRTIVSMHPLVIRVRLHTPEVLPGSVDAPLHLIIMLPC
jgi:hypothetical protein